MRYRVTERQVIDYTWEIDTAELDSPDQLDDALNATDGVPEHAISRLISADTSHEPLPDDSDDDQDGDQDGDAAVVADGWSCPGCGRSIDPSDVRRHAAECDHYDGSQGY